MTQLPGGRMPPLDLDGRAAIITGAASGIGRALAFEAAARGMSVALADIDPVGLEATASELRDRQVHVRTSVLDVRSARAVERFAAECFEAFSSIALVFANAGVIRYNKAAEIDLDAWNLVLDVNLRGAVHCVAAFIRRLVERAAPAQFVLTGSQASFIAVPEIASYVASKHAIWGLAEVLKLELESDQSPVGVSLLAPPRVATGIISHTLETVRRRDGDAAADALWDETMKPGIVASLAVEQAAARSFMILPTDDFKPAFAARVASLLPHRPEERLPLHPSSQRRRQP